MQRELMCAMFGAGLLASAMAGAATPQGVTIKMTQQAFVPDKSTVAAGTLVTWTNNDSVPHSVTANDGKFDSGAILPGKTYQWTAPDAGTIAYHCIFHPSMTAQITVGAKH